MKKLCFLIGIFVCSAAMVLGQSASADGKGTTAASAEALQLQSGLQLVAQLQNRLDIRKAKEGDRVVLKTTKAIRTNSEVMIQKGATLIGHITNVQKKSKDTGQSSLSLVFDRLETGSLSLPINATITSITQAATMVQVDDSMFGAPQMGAGNSVSRPSQGSGGLLGGITSTVGGVVNTTTQTVGGTAQTLGGVVNSTTDGAGNVTSAAANGLSGLRILQATDASAEGSSTLALTGGNLRLEKGTSFNLLVNNRAKAEPKPGGKAPETGKTENL